jgi:hypothetical protein
MVRQVVGQAARSQTTTATGGKRGRAGVALCAPAGPSPMG